MTSNNDHFSPVLANAPWTDGSVGWHYVEYYRHERAAVVNRGRRGRRQWGRRRRLYSREVDRRFEPELETPAAIVYRKLIAGEAPTESEARKWAQFLMSQLVRTPTFMRYEARARTEFGLVGQPANDRIGCDACRDLEQVLDRHWVVLRAHRDDFFIRTDNPVLQTGFLEDRAATLLYPLNRKTCFLATARPSFIMPSQYLRPRVADSELEQGEAYAIDFELASAASESVILHPEDASVVIDRMLRDILGQYPQPPYLLHQPQVDGIPAAERGLAELMSIADGVTYPPLPDRLRDYYGGRGVLHTRQPSTDARRG